MELRYSKNARFLFLAMLGSIFAILAYLIFMYNPLGMITEKVIYIYPGSFVYELWKQPPYTPLIKIYIFNVSNSEEFWNGEEELRFNEVGPYSYKELLLNANASFNENGTLSFIPYRKLEFSPEYSVGDPNVDRIISPNIPLLGITGSLVDSSIFANLAVASASSYLGSMPFLNLTITEYMYGYDDPLIALANNVVPNWIDFSSFGVLDRVIALDNSPEIVTININPQKERSSNDQGQEYTIESWNGSPGLRQWGYKDAEVNETVPGNTKCNSLEGVFMGTMFPPNFEKNTTFRLYRRAFCRSIPIEYVNNHIGKDGYEGYLYKSKENLFARQEENPDNNCYCISNDCFPSGLGDVSPCYYGIPIAISKPHFLHGDPTLLKQVDGLSPVYEKHDSFMLIHPQIGLPLEAHIRLQINLKMPETQYNSKTKPFNNLVIPLCWIEMTIESLPPEVDFYIKLLYHTLPVVQQVLMYAFAVLGIALTFGSATAFVLRLLNDRHKSHCGLEVNYYEIPVFPLKPKLIKADVLLPK